MFRLLLLLVVVLLTAVGGAAVALHHFYGWQGLLAFPLVLLVLVWVGKLVVGKLISAFVQGLLGAKSGVLRGATVTVHEVAAVAAPPSEPAGEPEDAPEPVEPKHFYAVDFTLTPEAKKCEQVWEPGELLLAIERIGSLKELEDESKIVGTTHAYQLWNGTEFAEDEVGKLPGPLRLRSTFEVKPGVTQVWLHYYNEPIGQFALPERAASA